KTAGTGRAGALIDASLVWDAHGGFAYEKASDLSELSRWKNSGIDLLSVNIGYDLQPWTTAVEALSRYPHYVRSHPDEFIQVDTLADVTKARETGRIAVSFDIEGANMLNGDLGMVDFFYRLGVRQMLFVYNRNNLVGGGCHDADTGLTRFGREVVGEMNRVGMVVDCSHCGFWTSMDLLETSESTPIFSHSNARALCDHERNITDEQIK